MCFQHRGGALMRGHEKYATGAPAPFASPGAGDETALEPHERVRVTRRATFAAAHVLCRPEWDEAHNREVFGACSTDHGHNYVLEVSATAPGHAQCLEVGVGGAPDAETAMVTNLRDLDAAIRRHFIDHVDHRHLNRDVEFLRGRVPTAENVALAAWRELASKLAPARLV